MDEIFTDAEDLFHHIELCILDEDSIQLSGLVLELTDYTQLFSNLISTVNDEDLQSLSRLFLYISVHLLEETENVLRQSEGEVHISEDSLLPMPYGGLGRPQKTIPIEEVKQLRDAGQSWAKISRMFHVHPRTLRRRRAAIGLVTRERSDISNEDLDFNIREIVLEHPSAGYVYVWAALKSRNIVVAYQRLKERLRLIDPIGIFIRSRKKICRRKYKVKGALYLWHMDGNEKLVHWRYYIHGCIDGHSRKIIYLSLSHNNKAATVMNIFAKGLQEHGVPVRVRGDGGSENVLVHVFMDACNPHVVKPFIVGRSIHNVRIERLWAEVNRIVSSKYKEIFLELEEEGLLDEHSTLDLLCLSYVYFERINRSLQNFVSTWNNHGLSSEHNLTPNQIWLSSLIKQRYSNDASSANRQPIHPISLGANTRDLHSTHSNEDENSNVLFKHLLGFSSDMHIDDILLFESEARSVVPDPLVRDDNNGKLLYSTLKNHFMRV